MAKPAFDPSKPFEAVGAPSADKPAFDPNKPFQAAPSPDEPGLFQSALNGVAKVGNAIDSYTGAPTRAAISAAQDGNNPISAFGSQFGADPSKAPTGYDIVKKAGLSDIHYAGMTAEQQKAFDDQNNRVNPGVPSKPLSAYKDAQSWSPAQVGGVAMDFAADPTLAIPAIGMLKKTELGAKAAQVVGETAGRVSSGAADALKAVAEKAAVNATGATGKQASKFADNAGRELLDRGIVQFGDSQAKIADRAGQALDAANAQIDAALSKLEAQGVKVDTTQVKRDLVDKVRGLAGDSSQHDVLKLINNEIKNITDAAQARGTADLGIAAAEQTKRGYSKAAGNWMDPKAGQAGKETYLSMRDAVENVATAADPETAALFKEGKDAHGLLAPIKEAAERRAATTAQHPAGGFLDMAASVAGEGAMGAPGAIVTPVARRIISPRITSSLAVASDKAADIIRSIPQLAHLEVSEPAMFKALVSKMAVTDAAPVAKVADQPLKGETKWANDGAKKLIDHAPDDKDTIEKAKGAMTDPKIKNLLIQASDLKPNTKAMDAVMTKLKSKLASGDE
jgi:hypothetical protein